MKPENTNWLDDIDMKKVKKASEVNQIPLPEPSDEPLQVILTSEPYEVEVVSRKDTMQVVSIKREMPLPITKGSMIMPKSLRFNLAKALMQKGKDAKTIKLSGLSLKIWSTHEDVETDEGDERTNKYYHCEIL